MKVDATQSDIVEALLELWYELRYVAAAAHHGRGHKNEFSNCVFEDCARTRDKLDRACAAIKGARHEG